ncbi:MAG TPA: phenylalanine--tRNA ligase subunit beta [Clostridiaceae bacterium]|nr:phenylalanine--tRNA ligase subunit beta [Clostridiaceae bacterium]
MKVPLSWLKDYVDIEVGSKELANAMTMSGSKVEGIEVQGEEISKVVVGKIVSLEKHPNADKLLVTQVDVGSEVIQVVTGAKNVKVGDYVPVALHGATLPGGIKITKGKLRGVESNGMMCSIQELNLTKDDFPEAAEDGIFILEEGLPLGKDIKEALGLNETVLEFEITSNRPDCLSVLGIAREAAATLKSKFKKPEIKVKEEGDEAHKYASVEIQAPDLCPRYAARIVKDVKIAPSPKWMRDRLRAAGVRPINNIVDITNYVMLELGQPMHAFDLEYLEDRKIVVRRAFDGEVIKTLDDQERKLDSSMLMIADGKKPVAVAGVMGGANSEITENTRTILFESANFDGISVRLTAKKLGMRTEASSRFEKGLDIENVITALDRAAQLVEELGAGTVCKGIIDCYPEKYEQKLISFNPGRINALLGTSISKDEMVEIFTRLELEVDEGNMVVKVPSFRRDIEREADLAEEVARFYGYNNIKATLLEGKATTVGRKTYKQRIEDIVVNTMLCCGLYETYTYSFTSPKVFEMIRLPKDSKLRRAVVISNPLGEDYSIMRTTTIPDMLRCLSTNYNRRIEEAKLFELSYVYLPVDEQIKQLPEEKETLTIGMYGNLDFYDLKGVIEELMAALGIDNCEYVPEKNNPTFHPGRTANLVVNGETIGVIGQIHPEVTKKFECPDETYIGIVDFMSLVKNSSLKSEYKQLPKYPAVTRDIAMLVKDGIMVKQIEDIIRQSSGKILEEIKLFDVYKGKQVPEGMKSVAYSITFRAEDRTLTDDDINKVMDKILNNLKYKLGAQLR